MSGEPVILTDDDLRRLARSYCQEVRSERSGKGPRPRPADAILAKAFAAGAASNRHTLIAEIQAAGKPPGDTAIAARWSRILREVMVQNYAEHLQIIGDDQLDPHVY